MSMNNIIIRLLRSFESRTEAIRKIIFMAKFEGKQTIFAAHFSHIFL